MTYSLETGRVTQLCSWLDGVCETLMPRNGLTIKRKLQSLTNSKIDLMDESLFIRIHVIIVNYFKPDSTLPTRGAFLWDGLD